MIGSLREVRPSWWSFGALTCLSVAATGLVIASAGGRSAAQSAALAALRQRSVVIHRVVVRRAPRRTVAAVAASPVSSPAPSVSPAASTVQSAAPAAPALASVPATVPAVVSVPATPAAPVLPKVSHVFEITLTTTGYAAAFGRASKAPYLRSLARRATFLSGYRSLGAGELADSVAMVSGQGPNRDTRAGCPTYASFPQTAKPDAHGVLGGAGCVYPNTVLTLGDQVTASGHAWKAYVAGLGGDASCVHPDAGGADAPMPGAGPSYDLLHNPFVYFHSLLDLGDCASDDVSLDRLPAALSSASRTAALSFIVPGVCEDAATSSCATGGRFGIAAEDAFLREWVPRILRSAAYRHGGVLVIALAGSASGGSAGAAGTAGAASAAGGGGAAGGRGGVDGERTGALVLSPLSPKPSVVKTAYGPYSLLRSIEDMLGYTPLAHARSAPSFAARVLGVRTSSEQK